MSSYSPLTFFYHSILLTTLAMLFSFVAYTMIEKQRLDGKLCF